MVACGTAYYACLTAKYWFEQIARLPVEVDFASEFRYREPPIPARSAAIFVSQSGETADTLAALRYCTEKSDRIAAVINVPESSIARESDLVLPIHAGVEIGVASTKAFTCQLIVLFLLAIKAAEQRGTIDAEIRDDFISGLRALPNIFNAGLGSNGQMQRASLKLAEARDVLFLGRGIMYPIALEGALKLKEISYIHAEAYAAGELKHGPIALIDKNVPVVVMAPRDALFEKTLSNMQEVMAREGRVILVSDCNGHQRVRKRCVCDDRNAESTRYAGAHALRNPGTTAGLSHCGCKRHRCGPTSQSRKIGYRGVNHGYAIRRTERRAQQIYSITTYLFLRHSRP